MCHERPPSPPNDTSSTNRRLSFISFIELLVSWCHTRPRWLIPSPPTVPQRILVQLRSVGRLVSLARITVSIRRKMAHQTEKAFHCGVPRHHPVRSGQSRIQPPSSLISRGWEEYSYGVYPSAASDHPPLLVSSQLRQIEFGTPSRDDVERSSRTWLPMKSVGMLHSIVVDSQRGLQAA